jgi:tRNA-binding protein
MNNIMEDLLTWDEFKKVDIRVGTILSAEVFKEARKPAYKMTIDFGDAGIKRSSAQITRLYHPDDLIGKQILAVINFPPKQIAAFRSECLILGAMGNEGEVILLSPDRITSNGLRIG